MGNVLHGLKEWFSEGGDVGPSQGAFWGYLAGVIVILAWTAIMSGLTVGLMSIDGLKLQLLKETGKPIDKKRVASIEPLLHNHHFLLASIVCANVFAMELLPLIMKFICPEGVAFLLSLTLVLAFGEVLPQALCLNDPIRYGAMFVPMIRVVQVMFYPLAKPVAVLMEKILGHDENSVLFRRRELKALLEMHMIKPVEPVIHGAGGTTTDNGNNTAERRTDGTGKEVNSGSTGLLPEEVMMMQGALSLTSKTVHDIHKPIEKVFMLDDTTVLTDDVMNQIHYSGHSRIPVYNHHDNSDIVGLLLVKKLAGVPLNENRIIAQEMSTKPLFFDKSTTLRYALKEFQKGQSHLAMVTSSNDQQQGNYTTEGNEQQQQHILGIVTLEMVIEVLIQNEIIDETDMKTKQSTMLKRLATLSSQHNLV